MAETKKPLVFRDRDTKEKIPFYVKTEDVELPDGTDIGTKVAELEDEIGQAGQGTVTGVKVGSNTYEPTEGVVDISGAVPTSTSDLNNNSDFTTKTYVDAAVQAVQTALNNLMNGQNVTDAIDTFNEIVDFLDDIDTDDPTLSNLLLALNNAITALQTALAGKISGIKANGASTTLPVDQNGIVELPEAQAGGLTESDIVVTPGSNSFSIRVGSTYYLVNLNHTHAGMAKIVKFVEGEEPDPMRDDTIYVQVDDMQDPGEIQKLYLFGLAFEGGGGVIDETPRLTSPAVGTEIDFNGQSSTTLRVKGLYLGSQLTITKSGYLTITANGNAVSTISATDANNGIELAIAKGANYTNEGASLTISSGEVTRTVVVKDSTMLPGGLFANKAWATRASVQTPVELSGYCITNFRVPKQASGRMKVSVKAGFTIESSGLDFIGCALNKGADNNTNFNSTDAWGQRTDPMLFTPAAGDGTAISATFKTSEIANCYIYDHNAGQYLWAGENVDTSVAPPIPS